LTKKRKDPASKQQHQQEFSTRVNLMDEEEDAIVYHSISSYKNSKDSFAMAFYQNIESTIKNNFNKKDQEGKIMSQEIDMNLSARDSNNFHFNDLMKIVTMGFSKECIKNLLDKKVQDVVQKKQKKDCFFFES